MRIALDIEGGDYAPSATLTGAYQAKSAFPDHVEIVLIGNEAVAREWFHREGLDASLFSFVHAADTIGMNENPVKAFVGKPESSIAKGYTLLAKGDIDAFASTGNTGSMLVGAVQVARPLPGVLRPCISTLMPQTNGSYNIILDVGTNMDCKAEFLAQFAVLGTLYARHIHGVEKPRVALLNIGEEAEKGNAVIKATYALLTEHPLINFIGNIEGNDLFAAKADVVVCDGFTGNVVLKQAEAFHSLVQSQQLSSPFFELFNYEEYGGTPVLGIQKNVIIGHGKSSPRAVKKMLKLALSVAEMQLPQKIENAFH